MKKILIILLLAVSLTAWADKWYIATTGSDTHGKGTLADPWLTLKHAADTITGAAFVGDTIVVGAGTFTETQQLAIGVGVSIYGAGASSIINCTYNSTSVTGGCFQLSSATTQGTNGNQSISHLYIDGDNTAYAAIVVDYRSNVAIHDVTIVDFIEIGIYLHGGCVGSGDYTGSVGSAPATYESNNQIYNCTLTNNGNNIRLNSQTEPLIHDNVITETKSHASGHYGHIVSGWGEWFKGLKFYNNICRKALIEPNGNWNFHFEIGTTHGGNEIYNNEFYNGTAFDIAAWENLKGNYDYSWWIHNNVFKLDRQLASTEEPHASIAINFEASNEYAIVEDNYVENYPYGVALDIAQSPRHINDMRIHHNVFRNMGYSNATYSFVFQLASYYEPAGDNYISNIYFDNNTVHTSGNTGTFYINSYDSISGVRIRNNIIYNTSGNYYGWLCFWNAAGDIVNVTASNNDIYGYSGGATPYYHAGKTVTNYIASGNITSNPLFKSSTDFHLQSASPCINAGLDVSAITGGKDFHGASRYGAAYDIGAFEYGLNRMLRIGTTIPTINYQIVLIDH